MSRFDFLKNLKEKITKKPIDTTTKTSDLKWGHLSIDAIDRMTLGFKICCNERDFEFMLKRELKPIEKNTGISVDELYYEVYETNMKLIEITFRVNKNSLGKEEFRSLLAGLTVPIQVERDTSQR